MDNDKKREVTSAAAGMVAREKMLENRTAWLRAQGSALAERDSVISDREEIVQLREAQLDARREVDAARAQREDLLVQIRDANEKLVLASLQAQQLADDAIAARAVADDNAERFRALVLTLSAAIWRATPDGQIEFDPDGWSKLTGAPAAPGAWGWLEVIHPHDRERVRQTWLDAVTSAAPYACQHRIRRRDGGYATVTARGVPIAKAGVVREWIGMVVDVSDRVRVEEARDRFIGILGHDLRSPLASIVAGTELLHDLPEPFARTVVRIEKSAHRIEAIIRDLLDFARGRLGGGIPIAATPCDMRVICAELVEEMQQAHPTREILFDGHGDLRGTWDPDRIEQVVSNLVGNAIAHGLDPILVTSQAAEDRVATIVHNRGPAIPEIVIPTLFEPFTRVEPDIRDDRGAHKGLGLGLYIANEIVLAHGGTLSVTSTSTGTAFTFELPRTVPRRSRTTSEQVQVLH